MWGKKKRTTSDANAWWPAAPGWTTLPATLDVAAAAPHDLVARERLAVHLASLAMLQPPMPRNERGLLPGFMRRPDVDQLQDCRITKRALAELSGLLDHGDSSHAPLRAAGLDVADLHALRGVLYEGLSRTDLAVHDTERAAALVAFERENSLDRANQLRHKAATLRAEIALRPGLEPAALRQLQEVAGRIGARIVNVIAFEPEPWIVHPERPADVVVCSAFQRRLDEADALHGFRRVGWIESPRYAECWGHRSITALHVDDRGTLIAISGSHKDQVVDVMTLLSGGAMVSLIPNRGRTHFEAGPWIDALAVDPMPLADILPIHTALVRLNLARRPGSAVVPITDIAGCLELEDRERRAKLAFRLAEGLTEIEVRGTGYPDPDLAMYPAQAAASAAIAAAHAEHAAKTAQAAQAA